MKLIVNRQRPFTFLLRSFVTCVTYIYRLLRARLYFSVRLYLIVPFLRRSFSGFFSSRHCSLALHLVLFSLDGSNL